MPGIRYDGAKHTTDRLWIEIFVDVDVRVYAWLGREGKISEFAKYDDSK